MSGTDKHETARGLKFLLSQRLLTDEYSTFPYHKQSRRTDIRLSQKRRQTERREYKKPTNICFFGIGVWWVAPPPVFEIPKSAEPPGAG